MCYSEKVYSSFENQPVIYYNIILKLKFLILFCRVIDEYKSKPEEFNIDCLDPLNRNALIIALEKENIDLINLLLESGIQVKVSEPRDSNKSNLDLVSICKVMKISGCITSCHRRRLCRRGGGTASVGRKNTCCRRTLRKYIK